MWVWGRDSGGSVWKQIFSWQMVMGSPETWISDSETFVLS